MDRFESRFVSDPDDLIIEEPAVSQNPVVVEPIPAVITWQAPTGSEK